MKKQSLRQLAYESILTSIMSGQYSKGVVTSEGELAQLLGMSRTPVRAALQQLELEGFVRIAPKHGVIFLDSSSQRVGNLLDVMMSLVLFSYSASWNSNPEDLQEIRVKQIEKLQALNIELQLTPRNLMDYEFEFLFELISLSCNDEMTQTFRTITNRLFWNQNNRRWFPPFASETMECLRILATSLSEYTEFSKALFRYLSILKRTWN